MREIDRKVKAIYGISSLILMENAGIELARCAIEMIKNKWSKICVFCGKGNNGGDGFVCARHLFNRGFKARVFLIGEYKEVKKEARVNLDILLKMGLEIYELHSYFNIPFIKERLADTSLIIDAIFGIGLKGKIPEAVSNVIEEINLSKKPVLSADIPSGLDVDTGRVLGNCVRATRTLTFGLAKRGFFKNEGPFYTGSIFVSNISIPKDLLR